MRMSARDGKRKISPDIAGGMSWRQREGKEAKKGELPTVEVRGETMLARRRAPVELYEGPPRAPRNLIFIAPRTAVALKIKLAGIFKRAADRLTVSARRSNSLTRTGTRHSVTSNQITSLIVSLSF